jgi:hypothetical protein
MLENLGLSNLSRFVYARNSGTKDDNIIVQRIVLSHEIKHQLSEFAIYTLFQLYYYLCLFRYLYIVPIT